MGASSRSSGPWPVASAVSVVTTRVDPALGAAIPRAGPRDAGLVAAGPRSTRLRLDRRRAALPRAFGARGPHPPGAASDRRADRGDVGRSPRRGHEPDGLALVSD